jgi:hypothetical protein
MDGGVMTWDVIWIDTDKRIDQRQVGSNADGAVYEQRTTWTNPEAPGYQPDPVTVTTGDL